MTSPHPTFDIRHSTSPRLVIIAAVADNGVIGRAGQLPWRLPDDLKWFKQRTIGRTLIMGRKEFASHGGLLNRRHIVLTRQPGLTLPNAEVAHSPDQALQLAAGLDEVLITGGGEVYRLFLPIAHQMLLTHVHATVPGDTTFPNFDPLQWTTTDLTHHPADDRHFAPFTIRQYDRREP